MAQIYAAPLSGGSRAVVMLNRHFLSLHPSGTHNMSVHWKTVGIPSADMVRNQRYFVGLLARLQSASPCMPEDVAVARLGAPGQVGRKQPQACVWH